MASARSLQVNLSVTPYYHCMSRCVRRAFLCGEDHYSGQNFDHRKVWVRDRLHYLASLFAIDICAYAVMSNHLHVVLFVDEDRASTWSEEDIVARYTALYPMAKVSYETTMTEEQVAKLLGIWRSRLCDISWMMRALNEFIARRANKEDETRGRFWEGRFKSQAIVDDEGLLACMAYVDLNPVRAGLAESLETSDFTSIQERIRDLAKKKHLHKKRSAPSRLAPMKQQASEGEASHNIPIDFDGYLALLKWTGSALGSGKRGTLSPAPGLLSEHSISSDGWLHALSEHRIGSASFLGSAAKLEKLAITLDKRWLRGIGIARSLAAPPLLR